MQFSTSHIFKKLGLILWAFATLILCFLVLLLSRHMLTEGRNPFKLAEEDSEEFKQQESSASRDVLTEKKEITLFFTSAAGIGLVPEKCMIESAETTVENCRSALLKMISGPDSQHSLPNIPSDTRVRGVYLKDDGELILDISSEIIFLQTVPRSIETETMMFFGIVNTMTHEALLGADSKKVTAVRFLFDGMAPQETFPLNFDLSYPLYPAPNWIMTES
jgi:hypothetical protein